VLLTVLAFYRQFLVIAFDPVLAATQRLPVERLRMLLLLLIALTIVVSLQTVGVGLVAAMLVTPGATAYLLTRRLPTMMMVAALIGAVASNQRVVSELLRQYRLRGGSRAGGNRAVYGRLPVCAGARRCLATRVGVWYISAPVPGKDAVPGAS
jgi:hypothetical protein